MLPLPRKLLLALEAVVDIAYNAGAKPVQSKELTERQGISQRYLEQIMQRLVRAGVLKGTRGPRGGYRLARERRRITVGDIARVVSELEGRDGFTDDHGGSDLGRAAVRPLWDELEGEFMQRLDGISIEDLCQRAQREGVSSRTPDRLDFTI